MKEQVLTVLLRLLAIISKLDGPERDDLPIVEKFLAEHLNDTLLKEYLGLYKQLRLTATPDEKEAMRICQKINRELTIKQKLIVLVHLIELVLANHVFSEQEEHFLRVIYEALNLEKRQYDRLIAFITDRFELVEPENLMLLAGQQPAQGQGHFRSITGLRSLLAVVRMPKMNAFLIRQVGQYDPIYLNGDKMVAGHTYLFDAGSVIKGGRIDSVYFSQVASAFIGIKLADQTTFEAKKIEYTFPSGDLGLRSIDVAEQSGSLVAIMGASGSGKSTLLNVLNGTLRPQKGTVCINGIDIYESPEAVKGVIGYVPQDDLLVEELTVYQNLYYSAKLSMADQPDAKLDEIVSQMLARLGLLDAQNLKVGSVLEKTISGGQRKRLNIGLELLRQPAILFVDEPTSGLSSRDSENVMDFLYELTRSGKLIFTIIHQPSSDIFKLFDRLLILDVGGYPIYYGNPVESLTYFKTITNQTNKEEGACVTCGNISVEQVFSIIESRVLDEYGQPTAVRKNSPKKWNRYYKERIALPEVDRHDNPPPSTLHIPHRWKQFVIFCERGLRTKVSDTPYLAVKLLQAPLLALVLAFIVRFYYTDADAHGEYLFSENMNMPAFLFMSVIVALFIGLTSSAEELIRDAKIRKRETFLHLSRNSYLVSKIVILFAFSVVQSWAYVLISNQIVGIEGMNFYYWAMLFTVCCFANVLGLNLSSMFDQSATVYNVIPLILIPQLILGGIVIKFDEVNPLLADEKGRVPIIGEIMASRWAFEGLVVMQFRENDFGKPYFELDQLIASADYERVYHLPALRAKWQLCSQPTNLSANELADKKMLLASELKRLNDRYEMGFPLPTGWESKPGALDSLDRQHIGRFLGQTEEWMQHRYHAALRQKDQLVAQAVETPEGKEAYLEKRKHTQNQYIHDLATNVGSEKRIIEIGGRFVQKIYPIYQYPEPSNQPWNFRAHFLAPDKWMFGRYFHTFWFNMAVIWGMTIMLYFTLYFKIFRMLIEPFQRRKR